jgi:elongator complex protein 3
MQTPSSTQTAEAAKEIIDNLMQLNKPTQTDLHLLKTRTAAKHHLKHVPSNAELIATLTPQQRRKLLPILRRKNTRTISGVTVIAVMTKPSPCPQPEPCTYCPGGPTRDTPQSYTGHEPAAMRGKQNQYDPYMQVRSRMEQLTAIGHKVDKIELIVMGGTFPATPQQYQQSFIQRCLDAITNKTSSTLEEAKHNAENSKTRNVGITIETRPDWAKQEHINALLNMGVTRIELGVQNPDDKIYHLVGRTHTVQDVKQATQTCKDAGLKVAYHLMPGMPGSNPKKDLAAFKRVFTNPDFKPDMLKIYPCLVMENTKTHEWYQNGTYKPYSTEEAANLIAELKKTIPPWIRIMRVQRDIPAKLIIAGVKKSNLRQLVHEKLASQGVECQCIRCREIGHHIAIGETAPDPYDIKIQTTHYEASEGQEIFISAEHPETNTLVGYLRLRIPSTKAFRPEILAKPSAIVRELHVYGPLVPVGKHTAKAWQHKGFGEKLLNEAEHVARDEFELKKILVISALGTKRYYKRFSYEHDGVYVSKSLEK